MASNYSEETKAAVLAALLEGQSVNKIAEQYNIPPGTIHSWKHRQNNNDGLATLASEKKQRIGELLVELIGEEIQTLKEHSIMSRNPKWFALQHAEGMAVFDGVKYDKVVRMLEAFGKNDSDDTTPEN